MAVDLHFDDHVVGVTWKIGVSGGYFLVLVDGSARSVLRWT